MKSKINMTNIKQFVKLELSGWKKTEVFGLGFVICLILFNAYFLHDSVVAVISALCGISYTVIAGKGKISCYLFGLTGTSFYAYLAFHNALYGNLLLYVAYYFPMQILGIFQWRKHLKKTTNEIEKTCLTQQELLPVISAAIAGSIGFVLILKYLHDNNPLIDGVTTVLSILGMYLTVKRAIEQWVVWMIVNALTAFMWIKIALSGERVYATVIMWVVYFFLAIYFYAQWKKEMKKAGKTI